MVQLSVLKAQPAQRKISLLTTHNRRPYGKLWHKRSCGWKDSHTFSDHKFFSYKEKGFSSAEELFEILIASELDPATNPIRGGLAPGANPKCHNRKRHKGNSNGHIIDRDTAWVVLDIDEGRELPFVADVSHPQHLDQAAQWLCDELGERAPELAGVSMIVQWTSSAGIPEDPNEQLGQMKKIKARVWALLDRPVCGESLGEWAKELGADASVCQPHQISLTTPPEIRSRRGHPIRDPFASRFMLVPGEKDEIETPTWLVDGETHARREEEKRRLAEEQRKARQATRTHRHLSPHIKEERVLTVIENLADDIIAAPGGQGFEVLRAKAYAAGGLVAGESTNHWQAFSLLQDAVNRRYAASPHKRKERLKVLAACFDDGMKEPWELEDRPPAYSRHIEYNDAPKQPVKRIRSELPGILQEALQEKGTVIFKGPCGVGKSHAAHRVLSDDGGMTQTVYATPTKDTRNEAYARAKALGEKLGRQNNGRIEVGRDEQTCNQFDTYLAARALGGEHATDWCHIRCPSHPGRSQGSGCAWQRQRSGEQAHRTYCTHTMARSVVKREKPDAAIIDEDITIQFHQICASELRQAIKTGEVKGASRLLELVERSHSQSVRTRDVGAAVTEITVDINGFSRAEEYEQIKKQGWGNPEMTAHSDIIDLMALHRASDNKGVGCLAYKGTLHMPKGSNMPSAEEVPTRLVMSATATKEASYALYGEHKWIEMQAPPPEHVTHIHIMTNGSQAAWKEGEWKNKTTGRILDGLRQHFPEGLFITHKNWLLDGWEAPTHHTYFGSTKSRGSNEWEDIDVCIAGDYYAPGAVREALAWMWEDAAEQAGRQVDREKLAQEAEYQLEIAGSVQSIGRIRPHNATAKRPKLIITIGKEERIPPQGGTYKVMSAGEALELFAQPEEHGRDLKVLRVQIERCLQEEGGVFSDELFERLGTDSTIEPNAYGLTPRTHRFLNILTPGERRKADLNVQAAEYKRESVTLAVETWKGGRYLVGGTPRGKVSFLAPSGATLEEVVEKVRERARREKWSGQWYLMRDGQVLHEEALPLTLDMFPLEAASWNSIELADFVAGQFAISRSTAQRRISEFAGGAVALRRDIERHYARLVTAQPQTFRQDLVEAAQHSPTKRQHEKVPWSLAPAPTLEPPDPPPPDDETSHLLVRLNAYDWPLCRVGKGWFGGSRDLWMAILADWPELVPRVHQALDDRGGG